MSLFSNILIVLLGIPAVAVAFFVLLTWRAWWLYPAWILVTGPLGVPVISFWQFASLLVLLTALTSSSTIKKDDRKIDWAAFAVWCFWPVIVWVMVQWMMR